MDGILFPVDLAEKNTPVANDYFLISDSAASNAVKKLSLSDFEDWIDDFCSKIDASNLSEANKTSWQSGLDIALLKNSIADDAIGEDVLSITENGIYKTDSSTGNLPSSANKDGFLHVFVNGSVKTLKYITVDNSATQIWYNYYSSGWTGWQNFYYVDSTNNLTINLAGFSSIYLGDALEVNSSVIRLLADSLIIGDRDLCFDKNNNIKASSSSDVLTIGNETMTGDIIYDAGTGVTSEHNFKIGGSNRFKVDNSGIKIFRYINAMDSNGLYLYDDNSNLGIFIKSGGRVGIGKSNPNDVLDVDGSVLRAKSFIDLYRGSNVNIDLGTGIEFDNQRLYDPTYYTHSTSSNPDEVTLKEKGTYLISFGMATDVDNGTDRSMSKFLLEEYNGSTWDVIPGSVAHLYNRQNNTGRSSSAVVVTYTTASANQKIRLYAEKTYGTSNIIAMGGSIRITIEKIG